MSNIDNKKQKTLPSLFFQCFILSMITFGGGSTIIALLQEKFVKKLRWINESEMLEMIALAQISPGATSVNTSMLIGYRLFKIKGAIICAIASILPPLIVISIITPFYNLITSSKVAANALRGVRACAAALVMSVSLSLAINLFKKKDFFTIAILICSLLAIIIFKINALIIIMSGIIIGILYSLIINFNGMQVEQ